MDGVPVDEISRTRRIHAETARRSLLLATTKTATGVSAESLKTDSAARELDVGSSRVSMEVRASTEEPRKSDSRIVLALSMKGM